MVTNCTMATTTHIVAVDSNTRRRHQTTLHHLGTLFSFITVDIVATGPFASFAFDWTSIVVIAGSIATSLITFKITTSLIFTIFF